MARVISKRKFIDFWERYPEAQSSMEVFYKTAENCNAANFAELKKTFKSADVVDPYIVFNVGGNKYRVVAVIHYNMQKMFVREVFTHREYDAWNKKNRGK